MEFGILGPLEATEDGRPLALGGTKQRSLLAMLLLHANEAVSRERLIDALWDGQPPGSAATALQVYVSQLRKVLDPGATRGDQELLVTRAPGYALQVEADQLDLRRFERLLGEGRAALARGKAETARATLAEALALWRGAPLADLDTVPFAQREAPRLEELRLAAVEERVDADLALGRHADLVAELEPLTAAHPLRERLRGQLMLALYRAGRQADALAAYQDGRRALVDELGLEPGDALQQLERAILNHDPSIAAAPAARGAPAGTVTLLFTDVEGSTQLLERLGAQAYADVLAEHRRLLREAFARHDGYEVDTQGDAFFIAFPRAAEAVAAADEAQRALTDGPVRVRIGIHTGEPIPTAEGYVGVDVHKGARIAAAGHGGQVLLSSMTRDLVDADVRDLGQHRLKDLTAPTRLYQLGHDDFPPLKTLDATNLPVAATPLLGREREVDAVLDLLRDGTRLATITGPGGTGKTRLALQVAAELVGSYEHGVFWVPLAALTDPDLVLQQIAQTIGARDELAKHVADKQMLLLVDNLEHLLAAAPALGELLTQAKGLRLLVTSRTPLRVRGEREYPLDPLAEDDAVTLFVERARDAGRDLEPDDTIAAICRRLDSLPLAIELAAARTKILAPAKLLERLEQALPILTGGARDAPERQQTLRATIEWSYDRLDTDAQQLFARLAVFAGTFPLEAAEEACDATLDALTALVDLSLLKPVKDSRFLILETIREFAAERLAASGDAEAVGRRHAEWFLALAEEAQPFLTGAEQPRWLQRLEDDHDNLRASLDWFFDHGDVDGAAELAGALWLFWYTHGHVTEARRWLRRALDAAPDEPSEARARVLYGAGYLAAEQNENEEALALLEAGFAYAKEAGATAQAAIAAAVLCSIRAEASSSTSDRRAALALGEEAVALARAAGDDFVLAIALNNLGGVAMMFEEVERGRAYLEESLEVRRRIGDLSRIALSLVNVGQLALQEGETGKAAAMFAEAAEIATAIGDKRHILHALAGLAQVAYREERWDEADTQARESLLLAQELGMKLPAAIEIFWLAGIAAATGDTTRAARLAAAAALHLSLVAPYEAANPDYQEITERVKAACDQGTWDQAGAEGRAMSLDEAADYALSAA
jgi:predicted ATPase/DNA-binding SARP family transcriptional activator